MAPKRSYSEFVASTVAKPTLTVLTADGGRIPAHNEVLRLVCSCLQNAPASDTWDLSSLLVNGSPVRRAAVTAVLEVLYSSMWALGFEAERTAGQYSLAQLLDMLLFADAVGCGKQALNQLAGLLGSGYVRPQLEMPLSGISSTAISIRSKPGSRGRTGTTGAVVTVQLLLGEKYRFVHRRNAEVNRIHLLRFCGDDSSLVVRLSEQQKQRLLQQVSSQLEVLLWVGFKLDLQQLLAPALRFLRCHAHLLQDSNAEVFSQRVVAAANGAGGAEPLSRACLQQPLGLGYGIGSMFGDVRFSESDGGDTSVRFTATLLQDFDKYCKGAHVEVLFERAGHMTVRPQGADDPCAGSTLDFKSKVWRGGRAIPHV